MRFDRFILAAIAVIPTIAQAETYGGQFSGRFVKQDVHPAGGNAVVMAGLATGTNSDTAGNAFMNGASVVWTGTQILDRGNGPEQGVITLVGKDGVASAAYKGTIKTTVQDGKPYTTGSGTWEPVAGTGPHQGMKGGGTYSLTMTSPTEFRGEWRGTMTRDGETAQK